MVKPPVISIKPAPKPVVKIANKRLPGLFKPAKNPMVKPLVIKPIAKVQKKKSSPKRQNKKGKVQKKKTSPKRQNKKGKVQKKKTSPKRQNKKGKVQKKKSSPKRQNKKGKVQKNPMVKPRVTKPIAKRQTNKPLPAMPAWIKEVNKIESKYWRSKNHEHKKVSAIIYPKKPSNPINRQFRRPCPRRE